MKRQTVEQFVQSMGGAQSIAKRLGITHQAVYKWCKEDTIPEGSAYRIAHVYGLPADDLLRYNSRIRAA